MKRKNKDAGRTRRSGDGHMTREEFLQALREMREDFNNRFAAIDAKFAEMNSRMDGRFVAMDGRFAAMDAKLEALRDWINLVIGRSQARVGKSLEETVAGALRLALSMYDVQPDQVKLRQRITDDTGRVGPAGRAYEIDILARDGETYVFEVKSAPDPEDVLRFNDKAGLAIEQMKPAKAKKVLVTLAKEPDIVRSCEELGILLV